MASNRVLARLARRSIIKAPLRSLLIVVLITIVVAVGTGAAIAIRSGTPTNQDRAATRFGAADTIVTAGPGTLNPPPVFPGQSTVMADVYIEPNSPGYAAAVEDLNSQQQRGLAWVAGFEFSQAGESIEAAVGQSVLISRRADLGATAGPFQRGPALRQVTDIDMNHPLATGLYTVIEGRFPQLANEVAVADVDGPFGGFAVGDRVTLGQVTLDVVGRVARPLAYNDQVGVVTSAGFDMLTTRSTSLRVEVHAAFDDTTKRRIGVEVIERELDWPRALVSHRDELSFGIDGTDAAIWVVPALMSAVVGIQLALVAAAAFAVGVRRRTKEFGQLMTTGMDGAQLRRMVLLEATWLGAVGAIVGVALGIVGVLLLIDWNVISELSGRYVGSARWNIVDWLAPAAIGVVAAVGAAWWPARSLANASVTSALAGHLPAGRPSSAAPRWGLLIVIVGSLSVAGLAASASADQGSLSFAAVFVGAVALSFVGTLLFIGSILTAINQRSGRFPLLARLVVRSSDRHRSRSWMVVGAFIAALALPVLVGASIKAYPDSFGGADAGALDRRLLTVRTAVPDLDVPINVPAGIDLRAEVDGFARDLNQMVDDEFELVGSVETEQSFAVSMTITRGFVTSGYGAGVSVLTPELVELFELPTDLVNRVTGDTVLYTGTEQLRGLHGGVAQLSQQGSGGRRSSLPVELIDGPALSNYGFSLLVSEDLAADLDPAALRDVTLHVFTEPLSNLDEQRLFERADEMWVERFGAFDQPSGTSLSTPTTQVQDWVLRQSGISLQQSYELGPTRAQLQWGSLGVTSLLAALIALATASLAAVELDGELQSMIATGAVPRIRRLMLGAQTLYHLLLAAVLGIPLALLLFYAVVRTDTNRPSGIAIPWSAIGLSAVVIPVAVAAVVAAVFRNGRPAISRRLS